MASGIGNKTELALNKIKCVADVPGVGKNLQVRHGGYHGAAYSRNGTNASLKGNKSVPFRPFIVREDNEKKGGVRYARATIG